MSDLSEGMEIIRAECIAVALEEIGSLMEVDPIEILAVFCGEPSLFDQQLGYEIKESLEILKGMA